MTTGNDGRIYNTFFCEFVATFARADTGLVFRLIDKKSPRHHRGRGWGVVVVVVNKDDLLGQGHHALELPRLSMA